MATDREFLDEAIRELDLDLLLIDMMFDDARERPGSAVQSAGSSDMSVLDPDIDEAELESDESVLARLRSGVAAV